MGWRHACALDPDGLAACWGDDTFNQLKAPVQIFDRIEAGALHTCGVRPDRRVVCWGDNRFGQIDAAEL